MDSQKNSFCTFTFRFFPAVIIAITLIACLPKEGGFKVAGRIPQGGKSCNLQTFFAKTDKPFKGKAVENEFNIFFGTSPERHDYYFVVSCDGLCYQSQPYLLGHMERIDLGTLELTECKKR